MKALLLKDIYTIRWLVVFVLALMGVYAVGLNDGGTEGVAFLFPYLVGLMTMIAVTTFSYDELDNGLAFLFTLPISRRGYALEKYLLCWLAAIGSGLLAVLAAAITGLARGTGGGLFTGEMVFFYGSVLLSILLIADLMLPLYFKFGGNKGRILLIVIVLGGILAAIHAGSYLGGALAQAGPVIAGLSPAAMGLAELAVFIIGTGLSMGCSLRIINRKEF